MDIVALRAFATVARVRTFTEAARVLSTSQPNLTRAIQRLEQELDAALFVRSRNGATLTPAGVRLLEHAERALHEIDAARAEVAASRDVPEGTVSIGTLATVGAYVLPRVVAALRRRHPALRVKIREGYRDELESLVMQGEIDLAIVQLPAKHAGLTALTLWREDYLLAVPPGHRLARSGRAIDLDAIVGETFVIIPGGTTATALDAACAARGVSPDIALETDNVESIRRMVQAGLGLALVPRIMAADRFGWRARLRPLRSPGVHRAVALVHRGRAHMTAAARAFRDELVARARSTHADGERTSAQTSRRDLTHSS